MIMRFRPANIRLINRRLNLPWLLLALSSKNGKGNNNGKNNPTDVQELTGSLHIRAFPKPAQCLNLYLGPGSAEKFGSGQIHVFIFLTGICHAT
jgi:hypothetical protein